VKLLIFVGINVFGALGWWAGEGFGVVTAFIASSLGSALHAGCWVEPRTANGRQ